MDAGWLFISRPELQLPIREATNAPAIHMRLAMRSGLTKGFHLLFPWLLHDLRFVNTRANTARHGMGPTAWAPRHGHHVTGNLERHSYPTRKHHREFKNHFGFARHCLFIHFHIRRCSKQHRVSRNGGQGVCIHGDDITYNNIFIRHRQLLGIVNDNPGIGER
jgi:hypothetical protein